MKSLYSTIFFDFDSTIATIETLDEIIALAVKSRSDKEQTMNEIRSITDRGMNGEIDLSESLSLRLKAASLHQSTIAEFAQTITNFVTPGIDQLISDLKHYGARVGIISGGLRSVILPVADTLGIDHALVFANTVLCDSGGNVVDVDRNNPLSTSSGKTTLITNLLDQQIIDRPVCIVGDGSSDLHPYTAGIVDGFVGFGAHQVRESVRSSAPMYATSVEELTEYLFNEHP